MDIDVIERRVAEMHAFITEHRDVFSWVKDNSAHLQEFVEAVRLAKQPETDRSEKVVLEEDHEDHTQTVGEHLDEIEERASEVQHEDHPNASQDA